MSLTRRHKWAITGLAVYWPAIFTLTHIPIPKMVRSAGVSDKMMHFLAYLVLTFFLWVAISPQKKAHWLKPHAWLTLAIAAIYGGLDEYLQGFVGRGTNIVDFAANLSGVITSLAILSILSLWPAALTILAIVIYFLPNFTTGNMFSQNALINSAYHFFGFSAFTMVWIQLMERFLPMREINFKWPVTAAAVPLVLLAAVKITSALMDKGVWMVDIITAVTAIFIIIAISWPTGIFRHKVSQKYKDNTVYKW